MKNMHKIIKSKLFLIIGFFCAILGVSSCNKEFKDVLPKTYRNDTAGLGSGSNVLYIILDGVKGSDIDSLAPTNITQLNRQATFSFGALADNYSNVITDASAWTTMITGVDYTKNNVTSEDFAGLNLQATPTVFTRIKQTNSSARTVSFASVGIFNTKLAGDATVKQTFSSDGDVKNAAVTEIKSNNPSLVVAQFHSAELAGLQGGYSSANAPYIKAITTLDGYIGELVASIKARKGYAGEKWLVVIASNRGGGPSGSAFNASPFVDPSRNIYLAYYSPGFASNEITQPDPNSFPFTGTAPSLSSNNIAVQTNTNIGNFGTSGEFTYMYKFRDNAAGGQYYPTFMGKRRNIYDVNDSNNPGWAFLFGGDEAQFDVYNAGRPGLGITVDDGRWHTVAFTIRVIGGTRTINLYVDGSNKSTFPYGPNIDNSYPLTLGSNNNESVDILIRDVALFNVGMTTPEVVKTMRSQLSPGDDFYSNLIGYWPGDEVSGTIMYDKVGHNNFTYSPGTVFASFDEISPNISPKITLATYRAVPNAVDIPLMVYSWLNIAVPSQWGLGGKLFQPKFNLPTN